MIEAEKLVMNALKMIQESPLLEQVKAFVKSRTDFWTLSTTGESELVSLDLNINFSTIGYDSKETAEPWFQCTIGALSSKHVSVSVFPNNSMLNIVWWQEDEVVKRETTYLNS